jgi:hypothetical protein
MLQEKHCKDVNKGHLYIALLNSMFMESFDCGSFLYACKISLIVIWQYDTVVH